MRRDLFKQGILALNSAAQERFKKDFPQLSGAEQDQILIDCEAGKLPTQGFTSDYFFSVVEKRRSGGCVCRPAVQRQQQSWDGWRMKEYPGAQMAYTYLMTSETFEKVPPVSLSSME